MIADPLYDISALSNEGFFYDAETFAGIPLHK